MIVEHICAECIHWTMGDEWQSGGKHGVTIESKGWCSFKPNRRKRWNYNPACGAFFKRKMSGFIYRGGDKPMEEDLRNITELMKELAESNEIHLP